MSEKDKFEAILRIENSLKEKGLQELYLVNTLYLAEPFRNNPYSVDEICIGAEGKACAWCHWDQRSDGHYLRNFSDREVLLIEQACNEALASLKKYRVQIVSCVEVSATDERNAKKTAKDVISYAGRLQKDLLSFDLGNEVIEIE